MDDEYLKQLDNTLKEYVATITNNITLINNIIDKNDLFGVSKEITELYKRTDDLSKTYKQLDEKVIKSLAKQEQILNVMGNSKNFQKPSKLKTQLKKSKYVAVKINSERAKRSGVTLHDFKIKKTKTRQGNFFIIDGNVFTKDCKELDINVFFEIYDKNGELVDKDYDFISVSRENPLQEVSRSFDVKDLDSIKVVNVYPEINNNQNIFDYQSVDLDNSRNRKETQPTKSIPTESFSLVNINTAGVNELSKLPGINMILAKKLIQLRQDGYIVTSLNDLGQKLNLKEFELEQLEPYITIEQDTRKSRTLDI